jgi:hypothetical protein
VLAAGVTGTPAEALWAMAAGCLTAAPTGSVGADLLRDGNTGRIVPVGDAVALAAALVAAVRDPQAGSCCALAAAAAVRAQHTPQRVADNLTAAYASCPLPPTPRRHHPAQELVSVVIPLHNHGRFLPAAVESVRRSGYSNVDIVVVDDGSTDPDTAAAFDAMTGVTKLRQPHRGLSSARNAGIQRSRGSIVMVLDADDRIRSSFLPAAVAALRQNNLGFVSGYVRYLELIDLVYVPSGMVTDLNLVLHTHLKSMVLYHRQAVEHVGGYDELLPAFEDWELQLRMALAGYDSDVLPIVGQLYRRHADSMSFTVSNGMRNELVQYLVRKHAGALSPPRLVSLLLTLVDLWKTGYEPSTSVILQNAATRSARHETPHPPSPGR